MALLLAASWWSDFFDGRLARRATEETRFSKFDLVADTFVGVAVVIGMLLGGHVPWVVGVGAGSLLAGYVMLGNASLGMLVQAIGYGIALILASNSGGPGFQVAVTTIALIAVAGFSRFRDATLPEFFGGLGRLWQAVLVTLRHGGRR